MQIDRPLMVILRGLILVGGFMISTIMYSNNATFQCAKTNQYAAVGNFEYVCYGQRSYVRD